MFPSAVSPPLSALRRPFFSALASAPEPYIITSELSKKSGLFTSRQTLPSSCADSSSLRSSQGLLSAAAVLRTAAELTNPCEEDGGGKGKRLVRGPVNRL